MSSNLIQNGVVPPPYGFPVLYICQDCGKSFSEKKSLFPKPVKCPECGSAKCIPPVVH